MDEEGRINDKDELKRRMEETRQSMTETVGEIKQELADALEWRAYLRRNPGKFLVGAAAVGFVLGRALKPDEDVERYQGARIYGFDEDRPTSGVHYAAGGASTASSQGGDSGSGESLLRRAGEVVAAAVVAQFAPIVSAKLRQLFGLGPSQEAESTPTREWTH